MGSLKLQHFYIREGTMNFKMKTGIANLIEILTCRFLKVIFYNCPQNPPTIPILVFTTPPLTISSLTESFKIFITLRIFFQFSLPATCHLQPCHWPCSTLTPDTCHLTRASLGPHYASPPPHYAKPAPHHVKPLTHHAQPAPQVSRHKPPGQPAPTHFRLTVRPLLSGVKTCLQCPRSN